MQALVFWISILGLALSYMALWYGVARWTKRYDVVDSAWGLGFVLVAWAALAIQMNFGMVQLVSALLVSIWGLRLFVHITRRSHKRQTDDPRYQALTDKWGSAAPRKFLVRVYLLQGLLIAVIGTPMLLLSFTRLAPNTLTYAGWVVWLLAIVFEAIADRQLATFLARQSKQTASSIMTKGLWRYSRHPNYFGEVAAWWGAALVAISVGEWWGVVGALTITVLITRVSGIPPIEKRYAHNPAYQTYRKRTSAVIPLPPRKV